MDQDNYVKQHHEEISLFEQCLLGSHNIGVTLAQRSRHSPQLNTCFVNFPPGDNHTPIVLIM